jgi:hypothetical protein
LVDDEIKKNNTAVPSSPAEILALAANARIRVVQNASDLTRVVIESLERLAVKLKDETPAVQYLWDQTVANKYKPRNEESLSDFIKIHLDEDLRQRGVVVNREVRIHRGQRTDVHVNAVVKEGAGNSYDVITLIIEVKCTWNDELDHAMETQLVGKYLKDNQCRHGLYCVGWFSSDAWDTTDLRSKSVKGKSIEQVRKQMQDQAASLSKDGLLIQSIVLDATLDKQEKATLTVLEQAEVLSVNWAPV